MQYPLPFHVQERLRVLREYPATPSLGDSEEIEKLLKTAKEKGKVLAKDGPSSLRHDVSTGIRGREGEEGVRDGGWQWQGGAGKTKQTSRDELPKKKR